MNNQLFDSSIVPFPWDPTNCTSRRIRGTTRFRGLISASTKLEVSGSHSRPRPKARKREGGRRERWVALTSTFARDAVLINVEGVEHVRVAVLSLSARDRSVQIEGGTFRSRRTKLAVLLQLQATEQWVVPQVHGRRLLRIWEQRATANHVTRVPCHACHQAPDDK